MPEPSAYETLATRVRRRFAGPRADQDRLAYLGSHLAAGGFALCSLIYLLPRAPFYPEGGHTAARRGPTFLALVWPFAGGVLALAVLAPPIFAYGAGWGIVYAVPAIAVMALLRWRRLEWAALLPGAIPLAVTGWVGLAFCRWLAPCSGAGVRWLASSAASFWRSPPGWSGWSTLPYTFTPGPGPVLQDAEHASSPWTVLTAIARFLDSRPEMSLQILLFASFRSRSTWYWAPHASGACGAPPLYLVLLLAGFVLLPILALDVPVDLGAFPGRLCAVRYNRSPICPFRPGQGCGVPLGGIIDEVHPKGRGAADKSPKRLHVEPAELARKLIKEMDDHTVARGDQVWVRNRYVIYLCPEDYENLTPRRAQLTADLTRKLAKHVHDMGYLLQGDLTVEMALDQDLELGYFGILAQRVYPQAVRGGRLSGPAGTGGAAPPLCPPRWQRRQAAAGATASGRGDEHPGRHRGHGCGTGRRTWSCPACDSHHDRRARSRSSRRAAWCSAAARRPISASTTPTSRASMPPSTGTMVG